MEVGVDQVRNPRRTVTEGVIDVKEGRGTWRLTLPTRRFNRHRKFLIGEGRSR